MSKEDYKMFIINTKTGKLKIMHGNESVNTIAKQLILIDKLQQENDGLKDQYNKLKWSFDRLNKSDYEAYKRIDKAIKYIKGGCEGHDYYEYDYILEILEGDK